MAPECLIGKGKSLSEAGVAIQDLLLQITGHGLQAELELRVLLKPLAGFDSDLFLEL
jgi:hypothetical protein